MFEERLGVRGWITGTFTQVIWCLALMALSIILNVFFRKGPFAYRGHGWVLLIMIVSFVFLQIAEKPAFGAVHLTEAVVLISYLVVSIGPVKESYSRNPEDSFWFAIKEMFGIIFGGLRDTVVSTINDPGYTVKVKNLRTGEERYEQ